MLTFKYCFEKEKIDSQFFFTVKFFSTVNFLKEDFINDPTRKMQNMQTMEMGSYVECMSTRTGLVALGLGKSVLTHSSSSFPSEATQLEKFDFGTKVWSIDISPCGQLMIVGLDNGQIVMRSFNDKTFEKIFEGHTKRVKKAVFSACQTMIISCSCNILNLQKVIWSNKDSKTAIVFLRVSPSGNEIVAASSFFRKTPETYLSLISLATGQTIKKSNIFLKFLNDLTFTPDGSKVIMRFRNETTDVWHLYPEAKRFMAALFGNFEPENQLFEGEEIARLLGSRMKRLLFSA